MTIEYEEADKDDNDQSHTEQDGIQFRNNRANILKAVSTIRGMSKDLFTFKLAVRDLRSLYIR